MANKNDFKAFALDPNANVMSQADWEALPALLSGFSSGKASSAQVNKALRQASFISACLAQFVCTKSGQDTLDNGDMTGFITKLTSAFAAQYLSRANPFGDIKADGATAIATALANLGLGKGITVSDQGANANGKWRKYSDGSIELWGFSAAPGSDGLTNVVYPIALPSVPNSSAISVSQFSSSTPTVPITTIVLAGTLSTTGFQSKTLTSAGPTGSGFSWRVFYAAF